MRNKKVKSLDYKLFYLIGFQLIICYSQVLGQNTVGLISIDQVQTSGGYNLIYPESQPHVYLLNECGEVVKKWIDEDEFRPGKTAYLNNEGKLLRAKTSGGLDQSFGAGGAGGIVELLSWDNNVEWSIILADSTNRQHHDVHFMENGNVLMIIWELKEFDELIANGFDTLNTSLESLWPDYILEIDPETNERIWEWHAWDHLVQDFDATKLNYGVISEHPELIDLNYQEPFFERRDYMHTNAIDYDPVKDQIILSIRNFNEIWIIDHSTTTSEAAGHTGGNSGKGGDLIYRWGNPAAYGMGDFDDQQLFNQHDAQWIDDFVETGYEHFGKIVLFNNKVAQEVSLGQILEPIWDGTSQSYQMENGIFLPHEFSANFSHPDTAQGHSTNASSIQILEDGHVLMCAANRGFIYELDEHGNLVWEYRTPLKNGLSVPQGFNLSLGDNFTFQCERYPIDFEGLEGKDLTPFGYIELQPNFGFCTVTNIESIESPSMIEIYPNPVSDFLFIEADERFLPPFSIYNQLGQVQYAHDCICSNLQLDITDWNSGLYLIKWGNEQVFSKKIVVQH